MPDKLPKGWIKARLGDICLPIAKLQPEELQDTAFTYFDIGGIDNENNVVVETKSIIGRTLPSRAKQLLKKDDILFSTVRTYLRKIAQVEHDYNNPIASTGFAVIRPIEGVSARFLFFQVLSEDFLTPLNEIQTGSSYPAVRAKDVFAQPIVLPPYNEQQRIATKLDAAFAALKKAEAASYHALARLADYREAVLNAAVTGELSSGLMHDQSKHLESNPESGKALLARLLSSHKQQWEADRSKLPNSGSKASRSNASYRDPTPPDISHLPSLPKGWTWASPDQLSSGEKHGLAIGPFGSDLKVSDYRRSGVPLIFVRNIRTGIFIGPNTRYITKGKAEELKAHQAKGGDILITKMGDPPGDARLYPEDAPAGVITSDCIRLALSPLLTDSQLFFVHAINSPLVRTQILQITKGVAQQKVSLFRFSSIGLPLPPIAEQLQIIDAVNLRLTAASQLKERLTQQLSRSQASKGFLLSMALAGTLVSQDPQDEPASTLLRRQRQRLEQELTNISATNTLPIARKRKLPMQKQLLPSSQSLLLAWNETGKTINARQLFDAAGFSPDKVLQFYEILRAVPEVLTAFQNAVPGKRPESPQVSEQEQDHGDNGGRFRLVELWLEEFKNLKDYTVQFEPSQGLDVVLGWNGTGKSNLFEALVIVFRDLHDLCEKNRWTDKPLSGFRLSYEMDNRLVQILWNPGEMKRPELKMRLITKANETIPTFEIIKREVLPLPRFVFGYYSGPTNRLAEHFLPMKQAHYVRLREAESDDPSTLARLLEQRQFFCAETHHAKYVLLAFSYKEDAKIKEFLESRLRIVGFESALFIIRKPRWAKPGSRADDYWGATGIMRRVLQRLHRYAVAPMILKQTVNYGYRSSSEEHYYFFLPDLASLHSFAAEYEDARTFFLALESIDFSELIHDVKIQVRVKSATAENVPITFHQLSEGEQQLLMVLGLLRFTKSHQSLVLLDEPDTHLNPHWSVEYLKDLSSVMSDGKRESTEQQSSQILVATHDPLVIASLVKEQIHLLRRDAESLRCYSDQPFEDPRGLGFTGILTSDMFGLRSDLDDDTMKLLDTQVSLAGKDELSNEDTKRLAAVTERVEKLGFKSASSDPYYRAFIKAVVQRRDVRNLLMKPILNKSDLNTLQRETNEILAEIEAAEVKAT
jgi:restriction endonuclease S subunit/predicted ATPase